MSEAAAARPAAAIGAPGDGSLEFVGLSKRYGEIQALTDLSFRVEPGELFGFVGSNGAGKTTAMRIALGVLAADEGVVRWGGEVIDFETRRRIGYMPEERGLYPTMKVADQLIYMAELHGLERERAEARTESWLERLGVIERRDEEVQKLSLGNQQRVQLGAALVHDPAILILDEPFSGLDPVAVDVMSEVLRERAAAGVPVIFSSHQLDLVQRLCDRVGILRSGQLVAIGGVEELRSQGSRRVRVVAPQAPPDWLDRVPGTTLVERDVDSYLIELDEAADDQGVLRAALATGPVHEFSPQLPSLAELYRGVVTDAAAPTREEGR